MTFDELKKEAIEKDWSAEQFEAALKEADIGFSQTAAEPNELNLEEMEGVSGGADQATCTHNRVRRSKTYVTTPGNNDWGYHVTTAYLFVCKDCGFSWKSADPEAWRPC